MSLTLNMVGGGGGGLSATDALLRVQAPAGSTVTITKGTVTKTDLGHENADDNSVYDYYFIIHQSQFDSDNPWNIEATDGVDTATAQIVINAADEYDVELSYKIWLIKNGVIQTANLTAVGMKRSSSATLAAAAPNVSYASGYVQIGNSSGSTGAGIAYFPLMDKGNKRTFHVDGTAQNRTTNLSNTQVDAWTAIGSYQDSNRIFEAQLLDDTNTDYETFSVDVDISAVTGNVYFGFNTAKANATGQWASIRAVNVYLQ